MGPHDAAPIEAPAAVEDQLNSGRIDPVFFDEDPGRQRLDGVVIEYQHGRLLDDRSPIELAGHEMNGNAGDAYAVFDRLPLRFETREGRQERRMDVQNPLRKRVEEGRAYDTHETGEANQIDRVRPEHVDERAIVRIAVSMVAALDTQRR